MAYVEGVTLADRVQSRGPVSGSDGARILREVAWALAYAHENGLVHRDVKPDNILLETSTGRVLVVDFGIAAAMSEVPGTGVTGTPEFMGRSRRARAHQSMRGAICTPWGSRAFMRSQGGYHLAGTPPLKYWRSTWSSRPRRWPRSDWPSRAAWRPSSIAV